jgi:hypothetical protein
MGRRDFFGYGITTYLGYSNQRTHRIAWQSAKGEIPVGLFVLHTCDNPPCVNSNHLWLGTYKDNLQDASRKGRTAEKMRRQWKDESYRVKTIEGRKLSSLYRQTHTGRTSEQVRLSWIKRREKYGPTGRN